MHRYFNVTYGDLASAPTPYALYLMIDGFAFLVESAIFFVMSRALSDEKWKTFYWCATALFIVDSVWAAWTCSTHLPDIWPWVVLNVLSFGILISTLVAATFRFARWSPIRMATIGTGAMLTRSTLDYVMMWHFYFPQ